MATLPESHSPIRFSADEPAPWVLSAVVGLQTVVLILAGIALSKVDTAPDQSRNLLKWTWIAIGINVVLFVIGIGAVVWAGFNGYLDS